MSYTKADKEQFLEILRQKNLNIRKACEAMSIDRGTFYNWKKEDWFRERLEWIREEEIDDSEETTRVLRRGIPKYDEQGKFIGWITEPSLSANIWFQKTQAKHRGYVERQEVTGKDGSELEVSVQVVRTPMKKE